MMKSPCKECPWSRTTEPGHLGGSSPQTFIGQVWGPFWLPCHSHTDYSDPGWKTDTSKPQCAGAAMMRDVTGRAPLLPPAIHRLRADLSKVFGSLAEFLAHHTGWTLQAAERYLTVHSPDDLLNQQMERPDTKDLP